MSEVEQILASLRRNVGEPLPHLKVIQLRLNPFWGFVLPTGFIAGTIYCTFKLIKLLRKLRNFYSLPPNERSSLIQTLFYEDDKKYGDYCYHCAKRCEEEELGWVSDAEVEVERRNQDKVFDEYELQRHPVSGKEEETFFRAVAVALYGEENRFRELRNRTVVYMKNNMEKFRFFFPSPTTPYVLKKLEEMKAGEWFGYPVIAAVSQLEKVNIYFTCGGGVDRITGKVTRIRIQMHHHGSRDTRACRILLSCLSSGHFDAVLEINPGKTGPKFGQEAGKVYEMIHCETSTEAAQTPLSSDRSLEQNLQKGGRRTSEALFRKESPGTRENANKKTDKPKRTLERIRDSQE